MIDIAVQHPKIAELQKALPQFRIEWDGGVIEPTPTAPGAFSVACARKKG